MQVKPSLILALDVMGGDNAPESVIFGADFFLKKNKNVFFHLYGDQNQINIILNKTKYLKEFCKVIHCPNKISSEDKVSNALKKSKNTSMRCAIEDVKNNEAHAVISSGNTGALMALSKICYKSLEGIDRPAISSIIPTMNKGACVLLDMGANSSCDANNLYQFGLMGDAYAKLVFSKKTPSVGLLNIGSEEMKGNDVVRVAHQMLQEDENINFFGYVEGDDITKGTVDVVVTDGFTGNIALKSIEGTALMVKSYLKEGFKSSIFAMIGYIFSSLALKKIFSNLDPRNHNGGIFLGLGGITIKSHGSSDAKGFANAIKVAQTVVENDLNQQIILELNHNSDKE